MKRKTQPVSPTPDKLIQLSPGMSLRQLAKKSGVTMPHLSRLFNGKRALTLRVAQAVAKALHLPVERVIAHLN